MAFSLDTFFWQKIAPAFSAFATSLWLATQKKVSRLSVREPTLKTPVATATQQNQKTSNNPKAVVLGYASLTQPT
ncbi:hypothetical protein ACH518_10605 [Methylomonas sp. HW2-6]|uniref:hypothetical protein n=1 Tax=Methylomonas sp. HW2-6 TaxID=3376687 RepID=UPI004042D773